MTRNPKGSVVVETLKGRLRLRLPKFCPKRYLSLGLADTPRNRKIASLKAAQIEADILYERFDPTLERYRSPYQRPTEKMPLLTVWDAYVDARKSEVSITTLNIDFRRVRQRIQSFPVDLSESDQFKNWLGKHYSPGGSRRVLVQLRAACNWALQEGLIQSNPFSDLPRKGKQLKPKPQPFTRAERDKIISGFETHQHYSYYAPFVKFLFWTGARTSEAIGLRWKDLDQEFQFITFSEALVQGQRKDTKTHQSRRFPVNQALGELLLTIRPESFSPDALVFLSKTELAIDSHNFLNRAWRSVLGSFPTIQYRKQYATRHTFITLCLEEGVPVALIAQWVGNSPRTIWTSYAGIVSALPVPEP
ncbi:MULTISPECIES: tyrosine-type recombinase/integrase [unclassified Coleofasciculus]|uniref:tyrosine-type recombinase/integrase n=1 Tax=unclassified Coleofasciculus TaxID=2692782 RepID=UPI00187E34F9|nr:MULTISPECIES: tyrosine-type recombinase/integrase [unclassified Coleofasciculus]MBE9125608.1 tyrosine-type recombinase/integrase [Coleofasciculus sp. LEGE 07081]MBE9147322.1 tyrosine-type recombinase/integrase [Coleofasciculus sp. LEGE 07092]